MSRGTLQSNKDKAMELQPIIVTHILPTTTAFGATRTSPPESVFIPGKLAHAAGLVVGQEVMVQLVPNTMQPDKTPWLAAYVEMSPPKGEAAPKELVMELLREGAVWTSTDVATELGMTIQAASAALAEAFNSGLCAMFELRKSPSTVSKRWFTCYPDHADVAEWVED
jgi:hypothetical protein